MSMCHLNDNTREKKKGEQGFDALHKIRSLLNILADKFKNSYYPEEGITIDGGMCFSGFKVYMANKPNKYGMKLYILAESRTGYIYNFEVYHGRDENIDNGAAGMVKRLLGDLNSKSHTDYIDRFYTSVQLAEELAESNTGLVGRVMKNKALKNAKLKKDDQVFRRKNNVLVL